MKRDDWFDRFLIVFFLLVGFAMATAPMWAMSAPLLTPPPADLFAGAERIALTTDQSPESAAATATYANDEDTARVAVRITDPASPLVAWGRITTGDGVNNTALGLVPAWRVPAAFDREAFLAVTGCADARMVATDTPRADIETGELGYTQDFAQPVADNPIAAAIALCLTPDGQIVQLLNVHLTAAQPFAPTVELTATAAAWLADEPGEGGDDAPPATCEPHDGEFRVAIVEGC